MVWVSDAIATDSWPADTMAALGKPVAACHVDEISEFARPRFLQDHDSGRGLVSLVHVSKAEARYSYKKTGSQDYGVSLSEVSGDNCLG